VYLLPPIRAGARRRHVPTSAALVCTGAVARHDGDVLAEAVGRGVDAAACRSMLSIALACRATASRYVLVRMMSPFGWVIGAPVGAGCVRTGGVALSIPKSPAEVLDADFRLRAGAQRLGELLGPKMPLEPHGRSRAEPERGAAENGRARGARVDSDGSRSVRLGAS